MTDVLVSDLDIPDPEFDVRGHRVAWQDRDGNLWVAPVSEDAASLGTPVPVDTGLMSLAVLGNGPEWAYDGDGLSTLVYTLMVNGTPILAAAVRTLSGWQCGPLFGGSGSWRPIGTPHWSTGDRRILYATADNRLGWRRLLDPPEAERRVTVTGRTGWWVDSDRFLTINADAAGVSQVVLVDALTATVTPLTSGPAPKANAALWFAPEWGTEALVVQHALTVLVAYRPGGAGGWDYSHVLPVPSVYPYLNSPELFVAGGKSYLAVTASAALQQTADGYQPSGATEVWLLSLDGTVCRRLDERDGTEKLEPESYPAAGEWMVFYSERQADGRHTLRRVSTGVAT